MSDRKPTDQVSDDAGKNIPKVREIFLHARSLSNASDLDAYLTQIEKSDRSLAEEVRKLLKLEGSLGDFLKKSLIAGNLPQPEQIIGSIIDRYRVEEHLGEGGFGNVYRVTQIEPIQRELAMKIIKVGMDSREVISRFQVERQVLALMDHPNIAHVYDAGVTKSGRLYFVMELVRGMPVTRYCDEHRLTVMERVKLFQQVCSGVTHAHQKGIIHRDIKPSNIVVIEEESTGKLVPKIIDFGIAKSLHGKFPNLAIATQQEMALGTPAYMSPEQLSEQHSLIDTRTDVYSLGIILYELLSGVPPFDQDTLNWAGLHAIRQILTEQDPIIPSIRFKTLENKKKSVANLRSTEPPTLQSLLRGDLDWIIMKAIEKDSTRRYQSVSDLSGDLQRHLEHKPVHAGPPGWSYRARKFVRRHRFGVTVSSVSGLALIIGLVLSIIGFTIARMEGNRARQAELLAQVEAAKAMTIRNLILPMDSSSPMEDPSYLFIGQRSLGAEQIQKEEEKLDELENNISKMLIQRPIIEATARKSLADCYLSLGLGDKAVEQLRMIVEIHGDVYGTEDVRYADSLMDLASAKIQENYIPKDVNIGLRNVDNDLGNAGKRVLEALRIYRRHNHLSERYLAALRFDISQHEAPMQAPLKKELAEATEAIYGEKQDPNALYERLVPGPLWGYGQVDSNRMGWEINHPTFGALREFPEETIDSMLIRYAQLHEKTGQLVEAESIYREGIAALEKYQTSVRKDYEGSLRSLIYLLNKMGKSDHVILKKIRTISFEDILNPLHSRAGYNINITVPGTYQLLLRWDGHSDNSEKVAASIRQLQDGPGGNVADAYGFYRLPSMADANFSTLVDWDKNACFEALVNVDGHPVPAIWEIAESGIYNLELIGVRPGAAVDAILLQPEDYPVPDSLDFMDQGNSDESVFFIEAEKFSYRTNGDSTVWTMVSASTSSVEDYLNYSGDGYLQVLPDFNPPDPLELARNRAWNYEALHQWERAAQHYSEILDTNPDLFEFLMKRGWVYEQMETFQKAAEDYGRAITLTDEPLDPLHRRGRCLLNMGKGEQVLEELGYGEGTVADSGQICQLALDVLTFLKRPSEAIELLSDYLAKHPDAAGVYRERGRVLLSIGEFERAKDDYIQSVRIDPDNLWRWGRVAYIYLLGLIDRNSYEELIQTMPVPDDSSFGISHPRFIHSLIMGPDLYPDLNTFKGVVEFIDRNYPKDHPWASQARAQICGAGYYRLGEYEKSRELLSLAMEIGGDEFWSDKERFILLLTMACEQTGHHDEAVRWYNLALDKMRNNYYRLYHPAECETRLLYEEASALIGVDPFWEFTIEEMMTRAKVRIPESANEEF